MVIITMIKYKIIIVVIIININFHQKHDDIINII